MKITILEEAGYEWAGLGLSYSYKDRKIPLNEWWTEERKEKAYKRMKLLAHKDGGHNKFLESIMVWMEIEAPRSFWSEMDTYRTGISKQSESTMHTLNKREPERCDFEIYTLDETVEFYKLVWKQYKNDIAVLKENLPEGFLQARIVCTNYKTLRNLVWQRENHRYKWWKKFCEDLRKQIKNPEFIWE